MSFSGTQIFCSQKNHKIDLFPNSYIMFLQNASTSEDQVGCKEEHLEPHRKQSRNTNSCIPNSNFLAGKTDMIRHLSTTFFKDFLFLLSN